MSGNPKICLLNRKPYRDKHGNLRVRVKCCGRKETGCQLNKQPEGEIVKAAGK
jgi:hypothetical protein